MVEEVSVIDISWWTAIKIGWLGAFGALMYHASVIFFGKLIDWIW